MPPSSINSRLFSPSLIALVATLLVADVRADQTLGNDPTRGEDPGFFHRASNDVGGFFKRLFGTDEPRRQPQAPAPPPSTGRSGGRRYNLDQPPAELRPLPEVSRQFKAPPPPTTPATPPASGKSAKSTPATPSPDRDAAVADEPPKPKAKARKPTPTEPGSTAYIPEAAPRTKPQPPAGPSPAGAGTVLYSNSEAAKPKQPEPPATTRTEETPAPPKVPAESPSVLTGAKTGKAGRVKSPYAPYSELDVTGLPSGSLALDPTTQKVFRIP